MPIAAPPPLPVFEFKQVQAAQPVDLRRLPGCRPAATSTVCTNPRDKIAGYAAETRVEVFGGKLSSISMVIDRKDFFGLLDAFRAKYGATCDEKILEMQNRVGRVVKGTVATWCFSTGKLQVRAFGPTLRQSEAVYLDVNQPAGPKPVVDF